jgi:hypothetical protein
LYRYAEAARDSLAAALRALAEEKRREKAKEEANEVGPYSCCISVDP